jgi:hypothetical protein
MHARLFTALAALAVAVTLVAPAATGKSKPPKGEQKATEQQYAVDTYRSFDMMLYPETGLPADNVSAEGIRSRFTSPTNIAAYMWSTVAARDLGIISNKEARERIARTLETLAQMEKHEPSGQYYNWYDPQTGQKLTTWPVDNSTVTPFLSSVDNGWLAVGLKIVREAVPQLRDETDAILDQMDFGFYYDPQAGLIRGGFWDTAPSGCSVVGNYRGRGPDVFYTCHHYGSLNTEPRIASYWGIARDQIPATHYYKMWRTFPNTCDWSWQEMRPEGVTRNYLGVDVFEGHYTYRGMDIVPSWGGSMFEALMVPLFVPEEDWAPTSWGVNHPLYVRGQMEHGLEEAAYGYWGFSPSNNPDGGYREYGVDPMGLEPAGYASDQERTLVDYGFEGCRPGTPPPATYGEGVVTPHASFLALDFDREAALANLANLANDFDVYGPGGFYDAVEVRSGTVSRYHLALDQGMIMAALANDLQKDRLQEYFAKGEVEKAVKPVIAPEEFTAGG